MNTSLRNIEGEYRFNIRTGHDEAAIVFLIRSLGFRQDLSHYQQETTMAHAPREAWKTRLGLVLAMAGNAVGLETTCAFRCKPPRTAVGRS